MIKKVHSVTEGIKNLLTAEEYPIPEFSVQRAANGDYPDTLLYDGKSFPLFESRYDTCIAPIAVYGKDTHLNSALNVYSFYGSEHSLEGVMIREMEIAEYVLHARLQTVTAFVKPHSASMILVMDNGTAANMDVGNSMAPGSVNQCQHRLITSKGMACDRGAGNYVTNNEMSFFSTDELAVRTFDDEEVQLYGLSNSDVNKALTAFCILSGRVDASGWGQDLLRYRAAVKAVYTSDSLMQTVVLDA